MFITMLWTVSAVASFATGNLLMGTISLVNAGLFTAMNLDDDGDE